jgi:hypothetical protein
VLTGLLPRVTLQAHVELTKTRLPASHRRPGALVMTHFRKMTRMSRPVKSGPALSKGRIQWQSECVLVRERAGERVMSAMGMCVTACRPAAATATLSRCAHL